MVMLIRTSDRRRGAAVVGFGHFGGGTVSEWMWMCVSMHQGERGWAATESKWWTSGAWGIVTLSVGSRIYLRVMAAVVARSVIWVRLGACYATKHEFILVKPIIRNRLEILYV